MACATPASLAVAPCAVWHSLSALLCHTCDRAPAPAAQSAFNRAPDHHPGSSCLHYASAHIFQPLRPRHSLGSSDTAPGERLRSVGGMHMNLPLLCPFVDITPTLVPATAFASV